MIYLYDGSFEGVLTCIFEAYEAKQLDASIISAEAYKPSFLDVTKRIETDMEKFQRVYASIPGKISKRAQEIVYRVWLSEDQEAANLIFYFLKKGYQMGEKVIDYIQDPQINMLINVNKQVGKETHLFLGILRFQEIAKGLFYAPYEPDHNITVLIAPHFTKRLSFQSFLIHDKRRNICAMFDGQELVMVHEAPSLPEEGTQSEDEYAELWKAFFKTIAIKERKNPKTQSNFMPKRYWKNLTEMQE